MKRGGSLFFIALGIFGNVNTELGVVGLLPAIIEKYGVTASQAGMLLSSFALIIALFGPWMTLLMSRWNRKRILIGILALFAVSNLASAFAPIFPILLVFRIVPALFHSVYFSIAIVLAAVLSDKERVAQASAKVFLGFSLGMALGIPVTSYVADQFSLEVAFIFSAVVNGVAGLGIALMVPNVTDDRKPASIGAQLSVLRKPILWLNIAAACFIFAATFAVYSYFAEYMGQHLNMSGKIVSMLLVVFGASGVAGNWYAGKLLGKHLTRTTLLYPIALVVCYILLQYAGASLMWLVGIVVLWGAVHTSGLIISQIWLTSEAPEAPEFANSLFVSFSNLGVTIGTAVGGWLIAISGTVEIVRGGILFAALALICIASSSVFQAKSKVPSSVDGK
ncbi:MULTISPECIES: MFS transporter [Paenibacillus]|uniref:Arabinose ABC transporter permease n=1 Tax=Paenibacillus lautus TaxID=1401 RepID=A0A1R1B1D0_PAELA|nr:MFS transporter [Paenibacillus lautus]OME92310.1 arabinose ABC transporter permease [Paenibacillus lautus]